MTLGATDSRGRQAFTISAPCLCSPGKPRSFVRSITRGAGSQSFVMFVCSACLWTVHSQHEPRRSYSREGD